MLTTFLAVFAPLASLQVALVVKLADALTTGAAVRDVPGTAAGRAQAA